MGRGNKPGKRIDEVFRGDPDKLATKLDAITDTSRLSPEADKPRPAIAAKSSRRKAR